MPEHDFDEYFQYYEKLVENMELLEALGVIHERTKTIVNNTEVSGDYKYAQDKWSVKQLLCHLIDAERIFCNRALRFARNDTTDLPGYNHDIYVQFDNSINRNVSDILLEYQAVRYSSLCLFQSFTDDMLSKSGMANGKLLSVKGIGKIIAGHEKHHINILTEKYLNQ